MTVGELKKQLEKVDDNFIIVMSGDEEGNNFSPLADFSDCQYTPDSTWSGTIKTPGSTADPSEDWDSEYNKVNAICLWPTN